MREKLFYWGMVLWLAAVEFSLIRNLVLAHNWSARIMYALIGIIVLACWYRFEQNRKTHRILWGYMMIVLLLAEFVRF